MFVIFSFYFSRKKHRKNISLVLENMLKMFSGNENLVNTYYMVKTLLPLQKWK